MKLMSVSFPGIETARQEWETVLSQLEPEYLRGQRWFHGLNEGAIHVTALDYAFLDWPRQEELAGLNIIRVETGGGPQDYFLPLILLEEKPDVPTLAHLTIDHKPYVVAEASLSKLFEAALFDQLAKGGRLQGRQGSFTCHPASPVWVRSVHPLSTDSSNTVLHLQRDAVLKLTRRLWPGISREVEIGLKLEGLPFFPAIHGYLTYDRTRETGEEQVYTLAIWQEYLPNRGSLWDALVAGMVSVMRLAIAPGQSADPGQLLTQWLNRINPDLGQLASVIAQFHMAMTDVEKPAAFTAADLQPIMARIRDRLNEVSSRIEPEPPELWTQTADFAGHLAGKLSAAGQIGFMLQTHGDLHLGQILTSDEGPVILDLEGEPLLEPEARAIRTTPLRDLAGLTRSFSYAGYAAYLSLMASQRIHPEQSKAARFLSDRFAERASQAVIKRYGEEITRLVPGLLPNDPVLYMDLLDICRLEKVLYELAYELVHRPDWVIIPLSGLRNLLAQRTGAGIPG